MSLKLFITLRNYRQIYTRLYGGKIKSLLSEELSVHQSVWGWNISPSRSEVTYSQLVSNVMLRVRACDPPMRARLIPATAAI